MPKYTVTFTKHETYEVEADNPDAAIDEAIKKYEQDPWAFDSDTPIHEITVD